MASFLGGLFGGGTTTSTNKTTTAPWLPQQGYMMEGLSRANDVLDQRIAAGPYTGTIYTGQNPMQTTAQDQAFGYTQGTGQNLLGTTALTAGSLQGATQPFLDSATGLATGGIGAANPVFSNTLANIAQNGAQNGVSFPLREELQRAGVAGAQAFQGGQGTLATVADRALADPTQATVTNAGIYSNNPALDGAIKAAQSTVDRTLSTETLPGLNRQAIMGGNLNSSRAAVAEAAATRDAASIKGNIDATMRGDAYRQGLELAEKQRATGLSTATAAGTAAATTGNSAGLGVGQMQQNQGQFSTNAQLGAAGTGAQTDTARAAADAQVRLGATGQLGGAAVNGVQAANAAGTQAAGLYGLGSAAGGAVQQDANAANSAAYQQWLQQNGGYAQSALNDYWGIVGRPLGTESTQTQTQTQPTNVAGGLAGLGMLAATPFTGGWSGTLAGKTFEGIKGLFGP